MIELGKLWLERLFLNRRNFWHLAAIVLILDAVLTQLIIFLIPYTEIDFETYMFQVGVYEKGERNYAHISGPSGPLVYPAGHVFVHRILYFLTDEGSNVRLAQQIYGLLYLSSVFLTCAIYRQAESIPNYILLLLPLSKRLHSIFMLRLFNDCWALVTVQSAILAYACGWDNFGSILFSSALSIKMSILLYLPGLLILLFKRHGLFGTLQHAAILVSVQLLSALPFISTYPSPYFASAFEFSRVFLYRWTVNWRFLPEDLFLSKTWAFCLLVAHLIILLAFVSVKWCRSDGGMWSVLSRGLRHPSVEPAISEIAADHVIIILFTSNLIGISFARSLHYQFYSWYAQQLPFLLWQTRFSSVTRLLILGCIEYAWNVFPSTVFSSGILIASNLALLFGIWMGYPEGRNYAKKNVKNKHS